MRAWKDNPGISAVPIDIGEDDMGTVTLWDEDYTKAEPMASAAVSLNEDGTTAYGTIMSEGRLLHRYGPGARGLDR